MKRFFGMMPSDEVEKEICYEDKNHMRVTIQAGPNGWTILWSDYSSTYKDTNATTEENFNTAYTVATERVGELFEMKPVSEKVENTCEEY